MRELTEWKVPIQLKIPACRVRDDVKLAAKTGADGIVIDGMQAGTGASSEVVLDHSGIPTVSAITLAREALEELGLYKKVYLVISGGIRNGVDAAKAIALGADAVAIGQAAMIALNCNREIPGVTDFVKEVGVSFQKWRDPCTVIGRLALGDHHTPSAIWGVLSNLFPRDPPARRCLRRT